MYCPAQWYHNVMIQQSSIYSGGHQGHLIDTACAGRCLPMDYFPVKDSDGHFGLDGSLHSLQHSVLQELCNLMNCIKLHLSLAKNKSWKHIKCPSLLLRGRQRCNLCHDPATPHILSSISSVLVRVKLRYLTGASSLISLSKTLHYSEKRFHHFDNLSLC